MIQISIEVKDDGRTVVKSKVETDNPLIVAAAIANLEIVKERLLRGYKDMADIRRG